MKRRLLKLAGLLLLGAVINVAVAWALAAYGPFAAITTDGEWLDENVGWWLDSRLAEIDVVPEEPSPIAVLEDPEIRVSYPPDDHMSTCRSVGLESVYISAVPRSTQRYLGPARVARLRSGWPCQAIQSSVWRFGVSPQSPVFVEAIAIELKPKTELQEEWQFLFPDRMLPLRPLWPGFAVNTLFYTGVLWMLSCGPFALRRMIRKRRGRCPACAYPIGTSEVCTECGAAVNVAVNPSG